MSNTEGQNEQPQALPSEYRKVDRRYRESKYFLMDQMQYAESVQEFRTIKRAILNSTGFDLAQRAFQFARVTVTNR